MSITLWANPFKIFTSSTGAITGVHWNRSIFSQSSDPIAIDTATPSATYVADGLNDYTVYLTAENWEGDEQPSVALATTGDISLPFTLVKGAVFSSADGITVKDAVLWWSASATPGTYNINFETYTDDTNSISTSTPAITPSGTVVTLETGIADPIGWAIAYNANDLVLLYGTPASSTTKNINIQIFSNTGQALTQSVVAETVPLSTSDGILYTAATGTFSLVQTATVNGVLGIEFSTINPSSGELGAPVFNAFPTPAVAGSDPITIDNFDLVHLSNGDYLEMVDWQDPAASFPGLQGLTTRLLNSSFVDITASTSSFTSKTIDFLPTDESVHWSLTPLANGISVLVYAGYGGVFMTEYDASGNSEGATYGLLPPISSGLYPQDFDSVVAMGSRFEVTFQAEDPNTGIETVYGVIYDTATQGESFTLNDAVNPSGQWVGTPYNDTVTYGAGVNEINGGGGTDAFVATNFSASQVSVIINAQGNVVLSDGQGDVDTLERFSTIDLSNATITIDGDVLTQNNSDGSYVVSTFNIPGEPYTTSVDTYSSNGALETAKYEGVTGEPYASYEESFDASGNLLETVYYYPDGSIFETQVACYCLGTLIATSKGEVPVETLTIGDHVLTRSGTTRPVKWIGKRSYSGRFIMGRKDMLPVCIKANALEENVPARDLWISPHHAMYLDGVLIEAKDLVNDVSIVQAEHADRVDYFHIELDSHDVIFAECAWSETFFDDESRGMFHNAAQFLQLYPDEKQVANRYYAPRLEYGREVEQIRRRVAARAGLSGLQKAVGPLRGFVDFIDENHIRGWAQNTDASEIPVCLEIRNGKTVLGYALADHHRNDLAEARVNEGSHGFNFKLPAGLEKTPLAINVCRALDGAELPWAYQALFAAKQNEASCRQARFVPREMRRQIMVAAHHIRRSMPMSMSEALKRSWALHRVPSLVYGAPETTHRAA